MNKKIIGYDAKRIVRNGTGLGSYGRTLINDLAPLMPDTNLRLYAPDAGRDDLRNQVELRDNVQFCYPDHLRFRLQRDWWRVKGVVKDLKADGVELYHGLSGELPSGLAVAGILVLSLFMTLSSYVIQSSIPLLTFSSINGSSIRHYARQAVSLQLANVRSVTSYIMVTFQRTR